MVMYYYNLEMKMKYHSCEVSWDFHFSLSIITLNGTDLLRYEHISTEFEGPMSVYTTYKFSPFDFLYY